VPLPEIIADYYGVGRSSKKVDNLFKELITKGANEFNILLDLDLEELKKIMPTDLALGIMRMRQGNIEIVPGFDGQYGEALIFSDTDKKSVKVKASQVTLFD
jgi:PHP family Zn ribbon phosphoesterase